MKLLVLTAIIAVVATSPILDQSKGWPWQVGKEYRYEVDSYTWTKFDTSVNNGHALKCQFVVNVIAPGHLMAKVEFAKQGTAKDTAESEPTVVDYKPLENIKQPFEIFTEEGRVVSLNLPSSLTVEEENLLKALVSNLQVDLSTPESLYNYPYSYDKEAFQGLFKRYEQDVTGHCETLYSVSPVSDIWRREIPLFAAEKDPVEVTKTKNFGSCMEHVGIHYGLPDGYVWHGIATNNEEKQLIKHTYESRMLVGKEGTIYMSQSTSSASVSPLLFGKQKSEVKTLTKFYLISVDTHNTVDWKMPEDARSVTSLMYKLDPSSFLAPNEKQVAKAQKLLQEITPLLLQPSNLPKADFLSKFSVLVDILSYMDSEELALMTSSVEVAKTSKNLAKNNMWIIYRDAVAQAGTEEAFKEIKSWIMAKKVQGDEAGLILSALAAGFYETTDIAPEFFNLAIAPEVQDQLFLNTSAILAATRVARHSDNHTFIVNDVIPRLSKELKQAIENGDSNKAQVYIRALGNLVQTEVLQVYAPYLEGKIPVSNYLRRQMVISLKNLANAKDEYVRAVLYSLLVNTAEPYEIRVAAALNIFMAYPTPEMFQKFAVMINFDPSTQVRAVLATSISYLATLKDPRFIELTKSAKSVMSSIPKEPYGYIYSADNFLDIYTDDDELMFWRELSNIGSEDSIYSSYDRNALRFRSSAWSEESQVTLSLTSVQQLFNYIKDLMFAPDKSKPEFKYSAKKIGELLNIKPHQQESLAGELFVENLNQQRLITFNEASIKNFIKEVVKNELTSDDNTFHFTKILNKREVVAIFPLATGMPFVFEYTEPILLMAQGQVKLNMDTKANFLSGSLENNVEITFSKNLQGSVGFLNTLTNEHISTGVVNKFQVYAPLKLEFSNLLTDYKLKVSFLHPEQDHNLLHYSVSPYSAIQMKDSPLAVLEDPATKLVQRPEKVVSTNFNLGRGLGMYYNLQGYSYSLDYMNVEKLIVGDILTDFGHLMYQKDVALTHYDFTYLAESTNKVLAMNIFVDTLYDQNFEGEMGPAALMEDVTADSVPRRLEIAERAAKGIKSAEVQVIDVSAVFEGPENFEWLFTAALAESHVDSKYQGAVFMYGQEQMNMVFKIVKPKMVPMNFEEALKSNVKVIYEGDVKFANDSNINLKGYGERSEAYKKQLLADPEAKSCLFEAKADNMYLMNCYKMIIKAHTPDFFKTTVSYKDDLSDVAGIAIYDLVKEWFSDDFETFSWQGKTPEGTMEVVVQAYPYDNYVHYEFNTVFGSFHLKNEDDLDYYPYAMTFYEPLNSWDHFWNYLEKFQYMPYCAVDDNQIWTFGGRSYYYSLSGSWHVVMVDEGKQPGRWTDLVILARRPSENQEEVYISYKSENGKHLEVEIKPSEVKVKSNTKEVAKGPLTMYWDEGEEAPFFEYYEIAPGVKIFDIENGGIRLMYDSHRLVIFTDQHRSFTKGICGRNTGQDMDDYLTPWGVVALPEHYGASWSLEGEFSDAKTVELKKEAKLKAYEPIVRYTTFLRYQDTNKSA